MTLAQQRQTAYVYPEMNGEQTSVDEKLDIPPLESSRGRVIAIATAVAVIAVATAVYLLTRGPESSPYRAAEVTKTAIVKEVRVTGHVELTDQVEVPAPVEGQLVDVLVQPGDEIEESQLLARLDKVSAEVAFLVAQAELQVARARISEAEAAAQKAIRSLTRTERLANKGLASASALETVRSEAAQARSALAAAKAEHAAAVERASFKGRERDRTDIVAPRSGLVLEVPQHTGTMVGPQTRLFRIGASLDRVHIEAPIGEADIGEMKVGLTAQFEVPTYPGRVFEASVHHINPSPETRHGATFYRVTLVADNEDHALLPGMTAQLRIKVDQVTDVLAVREATLRFTPEGAPAAPPRSRVWRVRGSQLEEIPVETGLSDGAVTEIRPTEPGALEIGDAVAIGLAVDGGSNALPAPSLSLRGDR